MKGVEIMLKLNRLNRNQEEVECLIVVEDIDGLSEKKLEDTQLFDESGNLVKTETHESIYNVHFKNGREIYITKATYDKLVAKLKVETL